MPCVCVCVCVSAVCVYGRGLLSRIQRNGRFLLISTSNYFLFFLFLGVVVGCRQGSRQRKFVTTPYTVPRHKLGKSTRKALLKW